MSVIVQILDVMRALLGLDIFVMNIGGQGARAINRRDSRHINDIAWLCAYTKLLRALLGKLEYTSPLTGMKDILVNLLVIEINYIWVKVLLVILSHLREGRVFNPMMAV